MHVFNFQYLVNLEIFYLFQRHLLRNFVFELVICGIQSKSTLITTEQCMSWECVLLNVSFLLTFLLEIGFWLWLFFLWISDNLIKEFQTCQAISNQAFRLYVTVRCLWETSVVLNQDHIKIKSQLKSRPQRHSYPVHDWQVALVADTVLLCLISTTVVCTCGP